MGLIVVALYCSLLKVAVSFFVFSFSVNHCVHFFSFSIVPIFTFVRPRHFLIGPSLNILICLAGNGQWVRNEGQGNHFHSWALL